MNSTILQRMASLLNRNSKVNVIIVKQLIRLYRLLKRVGASLRKAGDMYGVPYAKLCKKLKSHETIFKKGGPPTALTADKEKEIVMWLVYRAETDSPVTKDEMLNCVKTYLSKQNKETIFKNNRPGKKWFNNFKKRHANISLRTAQNLTLVRAKVTEENLRQWFSEVKAYLVEKNGKKFMNLQSLTVK